MRRTGACFAAEDTGAGDVVGGTVGVKGSAAGLACGTSDGFGWLAGTTGTLGPAPAIVEAVGANEVLGSAGAFGGSSLSRAELSLVLCRN